MLKKWLLLLCLLAFQPNSVHALDLSVGVAQMTYRSNNLDNSLNLRAELSHNQLYLWGSWEQPILRFGGQECVSIGIYGTGFGIRTKPLSGFSVFGDAGYYFVKPTIKDSFYADGALYAFAEHLIWYDTYERWETKDYVLNSGLGGSLGARYLYSMGRFKLEGSLAYRFLRLDQRIYGFDGSTLDSSQPYWEVFRYQDFSAIRMGLFVIIGLD